MRKSWQRFLILVPSMVMAAALAAPPTATPATVVKKPAPIPHGPVTAREAFDLARAEALRWHPDAQPFDLGSLRDAPIDAEGRSGEWYVKWSSASAGAVNLMSVKNGKVEAFDHPGKGGEVIELRPDSNLDSKKLLEVADAAGGAASRAAGAIVSMGLVENRGAAGGPLWHVTYTRDGKEVFHVAIQADTGKVTVLSR